MFTLYEVPIRKKPATGDHKSTLKTLNCSLHYYLKSKVFKPKIVMVNSMSVKVQGLLFSLLPPPPTNPTKIQGNFVKRGFIFIN